MGNSVDELSKKVSELSKKYELDGDQQAINSFIALLNILIEKDILTKEEFFEELYKVTKIRTEDKEVEDE
jgi:hypothetical protein